MLLKDKVAVITGAGSGMGEAIAKLFAENGAKVVVADINQDGIDHVVEAIRADGGDATGVVCNVALQEYVDDMFRVTIETYGKVDILVNNAGIMDNFYPVGDMTDQLWDRVMSINLRGPFLVSRTAVNYFIKNETGGVIINNASVGGLFGARGGAAYVASKHGLIGLTKNTAAVYSDRGIRCVAVAPGGINTNIGRSINQPHEIGASKLSQGVGPCPMGESEDVANVCLFLASDRAKFVNGAVITVDGGWTAF